MVNSMKAFLVVCCIAGIAIPYCFALPFFLTHGANFSLFFEEIFQTDISRFFAADLIVASVIFLVWSLRDSRERKISGWWIVPLSNLVVGLSLALPLYLLKRLDHK
jgi:Terpene cyclase DEP1